MFRFWSAFAFVVGLWAAPMVASAQNLRINDVSLAEGNAGTVIFTFSATLDSPAPASGVTFDIATDNGSATSGVDYTASFLTGQTIPAGASTYSFSVPVNGDTVVEPNETFFVNLTNVTGAIVVDTQGVGTILNDDAAPVPTLSEWTMILLGVALAGGAMLTLKRRRLAT